jgi:hypothetical protein
MRSRSNSATAASTVRSKRLIASPPGLRFKPLGRDHESNTVDIDEFADVREKVESGAAGTIELEDEQGVERAPSGGPEDALEPRPVVAGLGAVSSTSRTARPSLAPHRLSQGPTAGSSTG